MWLRVAARLGKNPVRSAWNAARSRPMQALSRRWLAQALLWAMARKTPVDEAVISSPAMGFGSGLRPDAELIARGVAEMKAPTPGKTQDRPGDHPARAADLLEHGLEVACEQHHHRPGDGLAAIGVESPVDARALERHIGRPVVLEGPAERLAVEPLDLGEVGAGELHVIDLPIFAHGRPFWSSCFVLGQRRAFVKPRRRRHGCAPCSPPRGVGKRTRPSTSGPWAAARRYRTTPRFHSRQGRGIGSGVRPE